VLLATESGLRIELVECLGSHRLEQYNGPRAAAASQGYHHWAVEVDDAAAAFDALMHAGAGVGASPSAGPHGSVFAYVPDPEGNPIELVQVRPGRRRCGNEHCRSFWEPATSVQQSAGDCWTPVLACEHATAPRRPWHLYPRPAPRLRAACPTPWAVTTIDAMRKNLQLIVDAASVYGVCNVLLDAQTILYQIASDRATGTTTSRLPSWCSMRCDGRRGMGYATPACLPVSQGEDSALSVDIRQRQLGDDAPQRREGAKGSPTSTSRQAPSSTG